MTRQVIGYYKPLRTFFLQGFYEEESVFDEPEIRLGTCLEEFPMLEIHRRGSLPRGYEINGLRPADVIARLAELDHKPEPTIWERIGLIF